MLFVKRLAKLLTLKPRRLCDSASSPCQINGTHFLRSVAYRLNVRNKRWCCAQSHYCKQVTGSLNTGCCLKKSVWRKRSQNFSSASNKAFKHGMHLCTSHSASMTSYPLIISKKTLSKKPLIIMVYGSKPHCRQCAPSPEQL